MVPHGLPPPPPSSLIGSTRPPSTSSLLSPSSFLCLLLTSLHPSLHPSFLPLFFHGLLSPCFSSFTVVALLSPYLPAHSVRPSLPVPVLCVPVHAVSRGDWGGVGSDTRSGHSHWGGSDLHSPRHSGKSMNSLSFTIPLPDTLPLSQCLYLNLCFPLYLSFSGPLSLALII